MNDWIDYIVGPALAVLCLAAAVCMTVLTIVLLTGKLDGDEHKHDVQVAPIELRHITHEPANNQPADGQISPEDVTIPKDGATVYPPQEK